MSITLIIVSGLGSILKPIWASKYSFDNNIEFGPIFDKLKEINYSGTITIETAPKPTKHERVISIKKVRELLKNHF